MQAYEAKRKAKDAERQAQEEAQEEEIRRAAEDRQRREEEEAAKWMHLFTVEAAGESALSAEQTEVSCMRGRNMDMLQLYEMYFFASEIILPTIVHPHFCILESCSS